jgi:hypothetical protein
MRVTKLYARQVPPASGISPQIAALTTHKRYISKTDGLI